MAEQDISDDLKAVLSQYPDSIADLEVFANYWTGEIADSSLIQYIRYLQDIDFEIKEESISFWIDTGQDRVSCDNFDEYLNKKADKTVGVGDRTKRQRWKYNTYLSFKKYLKAVGRSDLLHLLPDKVNNPQSRKQRFYLTKSQVEKLISVAESERDELAIKLMFYSGLRSYEVLNMDASWIETADDKSADLEIPAEYAKGRKENPNPEVVFLVEDHTQDLKQYIKQFYGFEGEFDDLYQKLVEENGFQPLFNFSEEDIDSKKSLKLLMKERHHLTSMLREVGEKAGINKYRRISPHVLRRSFIHHIYDRLNDLSRTADLARHSSPDLTDKFYLAREDQELKETHDEVFNQ